MNLLLVAAALWLLAKTVPYLVALFEKEHIRNDLTPQAYDADRWKSPYLTGKIADAQAAGLIPCGSYFTARNASVVKGPLLLYRTPEGRTSVALVSARFAGLEIKKVEARTRFTDGTAILTCDNAPVPDFTGIIAKETCFNGSLADVLARHEARLTETTRTPALINNDSAFDVMEQIEMARAEAMVAGGFARWADPAQTMLRRTWKGVLRTVSAGREHSRKLIRTELAKAKQPKPPATPPPISSR